MDLVKTVILPYLNFIIFAVLAFIFFKKPLAAMAAAKKQKYDDLLREAKAAKEEAEKLFLEAKTRNDGLEQELAKIKRDGVLSAETEAAAIVASAEKLAAHLKTEAQKIAETEVAKARELLKQEIIEKAHDLAQQQLAKNLTPQAQSDIISKRIADLKSLKVEARP